MIEVKEFSLFNGVDKEYLDGFVQGCTSKRIEKGAALFNKGDVGDGMYVLTSGKLEVLLDDEESSVAVLEEGAFLGEISLLVKGERNATVRAVEDSVVSFFDSQNFQNRISTDDPQALKIVYNMAIVLARRLRETDAFISKLSNEGAHPEKIREISDFKKKLIAEYDF